MCTCSEGNKICYVLGDINLLGDEEENTSKEWHKLEVKAPGTPRMKAPEVHDLRYMHCYVSSSVLIKDPLKIFIVERSLGNCALIIDQLLVVLQVFYRTGEGVSVISHKADVWSGCVTMINILVGKKLNEETDKHVRCILSRDTIYSTKENA